MRGMGGNGEGGRGKREGWFKVDGDVKVDRLIARSGDSLARRGASRGGEVGARAEEGVNGENGEE